MTVDAGSVSAPVSTPVSAAEFAAALDRLGPFEDRPALAAAVSGGADSTALALLAAEWAGRRGGSLTALIVDHGLRPGSDAEARRVAERMTAFGIAAWRLGTSDGRPLDGRSQAAARAYRYDRLVAWCRRHGVRHLLVGHHRRDQVETVLMRLLHGSGLTGLAGMAACSQRADIRLLRPLLDIDPERLRALLRARGAAWVEDPSNAKTTFERNRLRCQLDALSEGGLSQATLLRLAETAAAARHDFARYVTDIIADSCRFSACGCAVVDPAAFAAQGTDMATAVIARVLAVVGGRPWPPQQAECARLIARLITFISSGGRGPIATLGGCVVAGTETAIAVYREQRNLPAPLSLRSAGPAGEIPCWDGRFHIKWRLAAAPVSSSVELRAIGCDGLRQWAERSALPLPAAVPMAALAVLPAIFAGESLLRAPSFGGDREGGARDAPSVEVVFRPRWRLAGDGDFIA